MIRVPESKNKKVKWAICPICIPERLITGFIAQKKFYFTCVNCKFQAFEEALGFSFERDIVEEDMPLMEYNDEDDM